MVILYTSLPVTGAKNLPVKLLVVDGKNVLISKFYDDNFIIKSKFFPPDSALLKSVLIALS